MGAHAQIKIVGSNGQISLGKEFAGKTVMVDQLDDGSWIIKTGKFVPDSEKWVHEPKHLSKLEKALSWAQKNKPSENFNKLAKEISGDKN